MRTKNAAAISRLEGRYLGWVKRQPCVVCGLGGGDGAPSEAHHIRQGLHFACVPLCEDCHRGSFNGIHGQARMWRVRKMDEMTALAETIRRFVAWATEAGARL